MQDKDSIFTSLVNNTGPHAAAQLRKLASRSYHNLHNLALSSASSSPKDPQWTTCAAFESSPSPLAAAIESTSPQEVVVTDPDAESSRDSRESP